MCMCFTYLPPERALAPPDINCDNKTRSTSTLSLDRIASSQFSRSASHASIVSHATIEAQVEAVDVDGVAAPRGEVVGVLHVVEVARKAVP